MTNHCEVIPMGSALQQQSEQLVSDSAALFISNELLPALIGFWPKSINQINGNFAGNGIAYGMKLKGFPPRLIMQVVSDLDDREPSRDFAPEPQLLKRLCMQALNKQEGISMPEISIRSLELQAQVKALRGEIADSEVSAHVQMLAGKAESKGYQVTGRAF